MSKKLFRVKEGRVFGGVCSGIGEYFDIDPVIIRLLFALFFLCTGVGLLAYIIFWIVIPNKPPQTTETATPATTPEPLKEE